MKLRIKILFMAFAFLGFNCAHAQAEEEMSSACKVAASRGRYAAVGLSAEEKASLREECCNNNKFFRDNPNAMYALGCRRY